MTGATLLDAGIYQRCIAHLSEVRDFDFVVSNSLPIPYFGDLGQYLNSPLRVLTAALNPSDKEFPDNQPRFDVTRGLRGPVELETELSAYFHGTPYGWFNSFEPVLNGLNASYNGKMARQSYASTALHVDMCSPIATKPTWSKLSAPQRATLTKTGRDIFEWLVDKLEPHVVVASLGWVHLQKWNSDFGARRSWEIVAEYRTSITGDALRTPLLVQIGKISTLSDRPFAFVNGSAKERPFGSFSTGRKVDVGRMLLSRLRAE